VESSCEFGIEPSGSVKCLEAIESPNNWGPLEWCRCRRTGGTEIEWTHQLLAYADEWPKNWGPLE
jgi:hypothetical protein